MTKSRRWLITSVACLAILAGLAGYKYWQIRAAIAFGESFPEPSESVEAQTVTLTPAVTYVTTIGEIVAPRSVELRNELEGRVSEVDMVSGSRVQAGDVLLRLDASEEQARLDGADIAAVSEATLHMDGDFAEFVTLGARRVELRIDARNHPSIAVAERLGFELEGILRRDVRDHHGVLRDTRVYALIDPAGLVDPTAAAQPR